ncbi:hypothetical protein [Nocardioides dongkuii]|uniref:hypothetical protein n=1 Tax=Nocardioides dongkuii TaxID=2760089 RepID=UPI0015FD76AE|nr:hypothetical protein [Nocardioides dongkuii]
MISTLIALPYEIARLPLALVDSTLSDRLPETSPTRVTLDRALGSADRIAGGLLRNPDIARRGAARIERSDTLLAAARLEQEADERREQAKQKQAAARREAAEKRRAAKERAAAGLVEADATEARGKQRAKASAAQTAAQKKAAADKRAASRIETAEQRKKRVETAARTKKQAAQRAPKAELAEARETKQAAADARADAELLSELTEAKKQERQQG